jgi:citrate synthase
MTVELYHPGLNGVIVGETEICRLDGGLQYRGYCIHDLAEQASFLESAYLLLFDELPSLEQLADFRSVLIEESELPAQVLALIEQLPLHTTPLEAIRTGISLLAHFDPQPADEIEVAAEAQAIRLLARVPLLLGAWQRQRAGLPAPEIDPDLGFAGNLLTFLTGGRSCALRERALEVALIVSVEQEFNPSTYAARVVASARGDLYSAVLAGLGALTGPRLQSRERIITMLEEARAAGDAEAVVRGIPEDQTPPGFGHPVYGDYDPRAAILEQFCAQLAEADGDGALEESADAIERGIWESRKLPPNLDWPLTRLLHYLGIPVDLHSGVFVCARLVGWCAHAIEQAHDGQLIRPRARYRGAEDLPFIPVHDRG